VCASDRNGALPSLQEAGSAPAQRGDRTVVACAQRWWPLRG